VPPLPPGIAYVDVEAGQYFTAARRSDGSVVTWGSNAYGQLSVPVPPPFHACLEIAARGDHVVALYAPASSVGYGCGAVGLPVLTVSPPVIGQHVTLTMSYATPGTTGFVYASGIPAAPVQLGSGCTVFVDLATLTPIVPVTIAANGQWSWISPTPLPFAPSLVGQTFALQAGVIPTAAPFGVDITNGHYVTIWH
jgi:hypothetical protein